MNTKKIKILLALITVYIVWGSTYLAIRFGLESFPPFLMAGSRFIAAGSSLYLVMYLKHKTHPSFREWAGMSITGILLLVGGNGTVTYVQQSVSSGLVAIVIATTPIWMVSISYFFGHRSRLLEWVGLFVGLVGLILINLEKDMYSTPTEMAALILATFSWALGSALNRQLKLPIGLMASAAQMIVGGVVLLIISYFSAETIPNHITLKAGLAWFYLTVIGSIVAFSAYIYLLSNTRPALAMSYAYVNPIIAVILGIVFANEKIGSIGWVALFIIVIGVALVLAANKK